MNQTPDMAGLESTDCSGIVKGNADLEESCVWQPTEVVAGTTPLPDCYHVEALGTIETKGEK